VRRLVALAAIALGGCVAIDTHAPPAAALACPAGETRQDVAELIVGRNIEDKLGVSEDDFDRFLLEEVASRFPGGFTVFEAQGRWPYKGVLFREPSKVLTVTLRGPDDRRKVHEIAAAYERRFRQEAVLSIIRPACVSFHLH
jgi:hypothetical protein